jgi:excisionase family DNA binding protein
VAYDPASLRDQLDRGEWLRIGAVAALCGVGRSTLQDWIRAGRAQLRFTKTLGGQRKYHPDDVRALVEKARTVHGEPPDTGNAVDAEDDRP